MDTEYPKVVATRIDLITNVKYADIALLPPKSISNCTPDENIVMFESASNVAGFDSRDSLYPSLTPVRRTYVKLSGIGFYRPMYTIT